MPNYYTGVGSRETPEDILRIMQSAASKLELAEYTLRSGGADGADAAFESGVATIKEIWVPWLGFNKSESKNLPSENSYTIAEKLHPAWNRLTRGAKALHARNVHQILGSDLNTPSDFVLCYTHDGATIGGTATAIKLATKLNIPVFNFGSCSDPQVELDAFLFRMRPDLF